MKMEKKDKFNESGRKRWNMISRTANLDQGHRDWEELIRICWMFGVRNVRNAVKYENLSLKFKIFWGCSKVTSLKKFYFENQKLNWIWRFWYQKPRKSKPRFVRASRNQWNDWSGSKLATVTINRHHFKTTIQESMQQLEWCSRNVNFNPWKITRKKKFYPARFKDNNNNKKKSQKYLKKFQKECLSSPLFSTSPKAASELRIKMRKKSEKENSLIINAGRMQKCNKAQKITQP